METTMNSIETKEKQSIRTIATIVISVLFLLFQVYIVIRGTISYIVGIPTHLCFALALTFLYNPIDKKNEKLKPLKFIDYILFACIIAVFVYFVTNGERLENRMAYLDHVYTLDIVMCLILMVALLEATRRTLGMVFLIFIFICIAYLWLGKFLPRGTGLRHSGTTLKKFVEMMTMSTSGIFGTPLNTSESYLFYFMVFGALFATCGGGQLLIEIGLKFGKGTGGPAKAAVVSSGLMGMISGAAVANVTTTGCMTIPMMKKTGYTPEQAGAVEAVASTGGQIMPPVMGIGAFVMAEMLGIEYSRICGAAALPAIAYYLSIFLVVHFIAKQTNQGNLSQGFKTDPILPRVYLLLPAVLLIAMIISGATLMRSALYASLLIVVVNIFYPKKASWKKVFEALIRGCKQAANIAIPTAASGIVIACVINSGLANKLAALMVSIGGDYLLLALIIAMLGCMLFGMALPTVAAYLLASILFCPALIELGIGRLPANMFVFYFGIFAQITPPVCLASFTAASLANGNPWKTGWLALRWSLVAFLAAFAFVYNPALLLEGTLPEIIQSAAYLFLGTFFLAAGLEHYVGVPVKNIVLRILVMAAGIAVIIPETTSSVIGYVVGMGILVFLNLTRKRDDEKSEEERKNERISDILLVVIAVAGFLMMLPEFYTTAIGLVIMIATFVVRMKFKPSIAPVATADGVVGEVIINEIDKEEDDIELS